MNKRNFIGAGLCILLFAAGFLVSGHVAVYWNLAAFVVVTAGLAAALFLSYPYHQIVNSFRVARNSYQEEPARPEEIVHTLLDLSVRSKVDGILSLDKAGQQTSLSFLSTALGFLVDNFKERDMRDFLTTEMTFFNMRRRQNERVFATLTRLAPCFGVAGSVIGLIGMLMGIGDTSVILKHIPVAFISTLYGLILSNMVFAPMAESINHKTKVELLNQKLIMEGVVAIMNEQNPYRLERKLTSFLTPAERAGKTEALRTLTKRYISQKEKERVEKDHMLREIKLAKAG